MTLPSMITLSALASRARDGALHGDGNVRIQDLAYDSRAVGAGTLYFCRSGAQHDGHNFAPAAVTAGASALVTERVLELDCPQLVLPDVARQMGDLAAFAFADPSAALRLIGVTGTNGKTTTAFLIEACMRHAGATTGLIGTIATHIAGVAEPAVRTTPESIDLQRLLARMRAAGVTSAAMEVSSHGLAMHRVDGTRFASVVFTNLTQDHLDFHGTMEAYFQAKSMLFTPAFTGAAAINVADPSGVRLVDMARSTGLDVITYAFGADADITAQDVLMDATGSTFTCVKGGMRVPVRVRLAGPFNVSNALAALAGLHASGMDLAEAAGGIETLPGVPGRFERVVEGQDFTVLVDYAHTPDSVERVLQAARTICAGSLTAVVGCGGDRDRTKRPLMGRAAVTLADHAILTSDNPRSEDPDAIIQEMAQGARETGRPYSVEPDRTEAIRMALLNARAGDVIVIAGKGHESGQEFADRTIPFDDRTVAAQILRQEIIGR